MARDQKVKVRIQAKDEASKEVKKTQTSLQRLGNFIKGNFKAALIAGTAAIIGLALAFKKATAASDKQYAATLKLDTALSPLGDKAAAVSKELQEYAAALQKVTTAGDEVIIEGQALIASFTKNTEEIKGATKAALDLAAATGQSLQSAFLLLGRAAAGETSMLSRYGITLDESTPKAEKFAAALGKIEEQFGGQAQAKAKTYSGLLTQIGNAYGDLWEQVGDGITKNKALKEALEGLVEVLQGRKVAELIKSVGEAVSGMTTKTVEAITFIGELGAALKEYIKQLNDVRDRTKLVADTTGIADNAFARFGDRLQRDTIRLLKLLTDAYGGDLIRGMIRYRKVTKLQAAASLELRDAQGELLKGLLGMRNMHEVNAEAAQKHADAEERLARILSDEAEAIKDTEAIAKKLGITFDREVNAALQKNADQLEAVRLAAIQGTRSWADYDKAVAATAQANADLRGEAAQTAAAVDDLTTSTEKATAATARHTDLVIADTVALNDQAAAARRVQLPGGGSRLTSRPGDPLFTGGGPSGGTFTTIGPRATVGANGRVVLA